MNTIQHTKPYIYIYIYIYISILILGFSLISCGDAGAGGSSASSVPDTRISVSSQADLEAMINKPSESYILQNDITITTDSWTALGSTGDPTTSTAFSGLLDGNGHVISIEAETTGGKVTWDGLFYQLSSATEGAVVVKDLDFKIMSDLKFISSNTGVLAKNLTQGVVEHIALYGSGGTTSTANIDLNVSAEIENLGGLIGQISNLTSSSNKVELKDTSANINMTRSDTNKATNVGGLVGKVDNSNALLDSISVKGTITLPTAVGNSKNIGGMLGYIKGTLSQALSSVNVTGAIYIGGLVGEMESSSLRNVYANGAVNGTQTVGGLVGYTKSATINFALALGSVTGTTNVGGLIGKDDADNTSTASNAFYDNTATGQTTSALGTAKTTAELKQVATFTNFDTLSFWIIKDGSYPALYIEQPTLLRLVRTNYASIMANVIEFEFSVPVSVTASSFKLNGTDIATSSVTTRDNKNFSITTSPSESTANSIAFNVANSADASETIAKTYSFYYYHNKDNDEYYDVSSCKGLQGMGNLLSTKFELVQDIDCEDSKNWNSGAGFDPIGTSNSFTGTLLGNDFTISKLYINRTATSLIGLFGYNSGTIEALGIVDATITGSQNTGILASTNTGTIKMVSTSGSVKGTYGIGGIIGNNNGGTLSFAYSTSTVSGINYAGGLVGNNSSATSTISESYAAGSVTGTSKVGGLVGSNSGTVERSYYDTDVSGQSDTGKGDGKSTADMKKAATYVNWDTSVWNLVDGAYPVFK